jgi:uncharacterized protein YdhG (YjbR/CyaY superfamily)
MPATKTTTDSKTPAPSTVDEYLASVPEPDRTVLARLRRAITTAAPGAEERISYRIPLYRLNGQHLIGFAAFKHHLSLFVMDSAALDEFARELEPFDVERTKSTVRFTAERPIPVSLVKRIVGLRLGEVS